MVGTNIRNIRINKGFSLRSLAKLANVSNSTLSDIETNKSNASIATLTKLAAALHCNQSDLFDNDFIPNRDEEIHSFTIDLVKELLKEGLIDSEDNIPEHLMDLIVSALKADARERKKTARP